MSERTVADSPFCSSSRPTVALTISAPCRLKFPRLAFLRASSTCAAVVLNAVPDSAPTCGTRMITMRLAGSS